MNPFTLSDLKSSMLHERNLGEVLNQFLDWVENDPGAIVGGPSSDSEPLLEGALMAMSTTLVGRHCRSCELVLFRVAEERLLHGMAVLDGQPIVVVYFEDLRTGLAGAFRLGARPTTDIMRFSAHEMPESWTPEAN